MPSPILTRRIAPEHARIIGAMLTVGIFIAMAKGVGAVKEMVVAAHFGTGRAVDAFSFLFSLVSWPAAAWTAAASSILVPLLVRLDRQDSAAGELFRQEMLAVCLLPAAAVGIFSYGIIRWGLGAGVFGLTGPVSEAARDMLWLVCLCAPVMMVVGVLSAYLMAGRRHTNSLFEAVMPAVTGAVVFAAAGAPLWSLPLGTLLGYTSQALLSIVAQPKEAGRLIPRFSLTSPSWTAFWSAFLVLIASQLILSMANVVDQTMAARLGPSSNATLAYSNRLMSLLLALGATVISRATLPVFSGAGPPGRAWAMARQWGAALFALGLAIAAISWVAAPLAIKVLFQRGAFTHEDVVAVVRVFRFSVLQTPFYFSSVVIAQFVASTGMFRIFLYGNILNIAVKIGLNALLIPRFGLQGAMLSTAAMQLVSLIFLWVVSARVQARLKAGQGA